MGDKYLITGAAGHLGNTIVRKLLERGESVRALLYYNEKLPACFSGKVEECEGDVTDIVSLKKFFENSGNDDLYVIHCAGVVSIASKTDKRLYNTNVNGTKNIIRMCIAEKAKKLIYVSSVHAIPELGQGVVMREVYDFSPDYVKGAYAKTKAVATAMVLKAASEGLDACVVHPSGLAGPYDYGKGHITQLITDCANGVLKAGVKGGYDFVDVRDVADGIISCAKIGKSGECYILSGAYHSVPELFEIFNKAAGLKSITNFMSMWLAKAAAPFAEMYYKIRKAPPLFTAYSLYTLSSNANFSHEKASRALGYKTRPFDETVRDTVNWLRRAGRIKTE